MLANGINDALRIAAPISDPSISEVGARSVYLRQLGESIEISASVKLFATMNPAAIGGGE